MTLNADGTQPDRSSKSFPITNTGPGLTGQVGSPYEIADSSGSLKYQLFHSAFLILCLSPPHQIQEITQYTSATNNGHWNNIVTPTIKHHSATYNDTNENCPGIVQITPTQAARFERIHLSPKTTLHVQWGRRKCRIIAITFFLLMFSF